jgi:hypothetical protein
MIMPVMTLFQGSERKYTGEHHTGQEMTGFQQSGDGLVQIVRKCATADFALQFLSDHGYPFLLFRG